MRILTCASTGQSISLVKRIATSGEGAIWQTQLDDYLAKVYNLPSSERTRKLEVMVAYPPQDPNSQINHISFAWPKSLLKDTRGNCVGFLMPAIADSVELLNVYNPQRRQKILPGFNWLYLHTTAMNIASIVQAIHARGYVLGDIKPQNILINNQALPAVIDTDSFQVRHPETGELFRCLVGSEGFTPVELLGKDLATVEQTEVQDRFRLTVIIYLLLFGDHPFKGKWTGTGDSPDPSELLRQGFWPYAPNSSIQQGPLTIPLDTVHPEVRRCFLRCFNEGHTQAALRPTAREWFEALKLATADLQACRKVKVHYYSQTHGKCYWCDRKTALGIDIFPAGSNLTPKPGVKILQRIKLAMETLTSQATKLSPAPLITWGTNRLQKGRMAIRTIKHRVAKPASIPAIDYQKSWVRGGTVLSIAAGLFTLLLLLSKSKIHQNDLGLTAVGIFLCLGLLAVCFFWIKVGKQSA